MSTRQATIERGVRLEYFTVAYNLMEGIVAILAGWWAGSVALVGFGIDSGIEVTSGVALLWRLRADFDPKRRERAERTSLRIVGLCFVALAVYIAWESAEQLLAREAPRHSAPGVALAAVSVIVMPLLARAKRRIARGLGSAAMSADAKQTEFCTWLSAILLAGLGLNIALGWWWADPAAGLVMVPIIAGEGVRALRGRACGCSCPSGH